MIEKQKLSAIGGFPEWLPEYRIVEQEWLDTIRTIFESYGFCSIETRSIEPVQVLLKQGDTDKEIYALRRLFEQAAEAEQPAEFALHYDLTVPFARYVAAHMNDLVFPVKRYQIQKSWRGERPQEGRFREFYQCDIDVIDQKEIPLHFDAEMAAIMYEVIEKLGVGSIVTKISNRKVLEGFYQGLGVESPDEIIRVVDKLDKVGERGVIEILREELRLPDRLIDPIMQLAAIRGTDGSIAKEIESLGVSTPLLEEGLHELSFVMNELREFPEGAFIADLSVARGLAYYTGTVYESKFVDYPAYPTICAGGRYDNLVGSLINRRLPGIGISVGLTRIFAKLVKEGRIQAGRKSPTDVMVAFPPAAGYQDVKQTARALRQRGINVEMYHESRKLKSQLRYAAAKMIPYVWFPPAEPGGEHQVKDLETGEQTPADPTSWLPGKP